METMKHGQLQMYTVYASIRRRQK